MKSITLLFSIILLSTTLLAQSIQFTKNEIIQDERITTRSQQSRMIDFDNDGDQDIVVGNTGNLRRIQIFVNQGGQFDSALVVLDGFTSGFDNIAVADVDQDGLEDIIFEDASYFYTLLNLGSGNFGTPNQSTTNSTNISRDLQVYDLNNDSYPDLYWWNGNQIIWAENDSSASFRSPSIFVDPSAHFNANNLNSGYELYLTDYENDGDIDFVIPDASSGSFSHVTWAIDSAGTFVFKTLSLIDPYQGQIAVADYNNDGVKDIAAVEGSNFSQDLKVYLLNATYTISSSSTLYTESAVNFDLTHVYAADANGDGLEDLVLNRATNDAGFGLLFTNLGSGAFSQGVRVLDNLVMDNSVSADKSYAQLIAEDFNQDGRMDFVTSGSGNDDIIYHEQLNDSTFNSFNYLNTHFQTEFKRIDYFDVNADGNKDFIFSGRDFDAKVQVNYNDGNLDFSNKEVVSANVAPYRVDGLVVDLNNDGSLDLLYCNTERIMFHSNYRNPANDTLYSLYNNANIPGNASSFPELYVLDIDLDGDLDIVYQDRPSNYRLNLIENINNTTFSHQVMAISTRAWYNLNFGDIDNDGVIELVYSYTSNLYTAEIDYTNNSLSFVDTVAASMNYGVNAAMKLSDLDNDGDLDLVSGKDGLRWFENIGGTQYFESDSILSSSGAINGARLAVGDLNNDGLDDFANFGGTSSNRQVNTFINQGNRTFIQESHNLGDAWNQNFLAFEDVDGDNRDDILLNVPKTPGVPQAFWFRTCFQTTDSIAVSACDTYVSPSGKSFTTSSLFNDTIANVAGCDSIININLTIQNSNSSTTQVTSCNSYTWPLNGLTYNMSGQYLDTILNSAGCDSVISLNLTINTVDKTVSQNGITLTANQSGATYQWLDCNNGNAPISGATSQSYTATTNGNYSVEVNANNCTDTSNCVSVISVGLEEEAIAEDLKIFPNPTKGEVNLMVKQEMLGKSCQLFDVTGKLMDEEVILTKNTLLDLSALESGVYFLQIGDRVEKLILN